MKPISFFLSVITVLSLLFSGCSQPRTEDEGLSPFGILTHLEGGNNYMLNHLDLVEDMGVRWNRTDFSWSNIERPQGEWHFEMHDRIVDSLEKHHINAQAILLYDVPWAHPAHQHLDAWLTYVEKTVTRYKDRIRSWEVWNEPNLHRFWEYPDGADYATLLNATYKKIKEIDPGLTVVYAGTSSIPMAFFEKSFQAGAAQSFDALAFHPYRGKFNSMKKTADYYQEIDNLRKLMD
jgi:beta-xylosidase